MNEKDYRVSAQAQQILSTHLRPGMVAVDATCGNGNDSVFLADCIAPGGKLYAFDVQHSAVEATRDKLREEGFQEGIHVIRLDHARFDESGVLPDRVDCFMYNLGYLPGADHSVTTQAESTIQSLSEATNHLAPGGMITICLYPHNPEENDAVRAFCSKLTGVYSAFEITRLNRHKPPTLIVIVREDHDE